MRRRLRCGGAGAGVTLLEILVVIVILSMILGMTIAVLRNANRDLGVLAATSTISSMLRAAAEHARAEASPAWVVLDLDRRTIGTLTRETIGMWHFEDRTGAFGKVANVKGPVLDRGRVGLAYRFKPNETIECGEVPVFRPDQGVGIELWFYRSPRGNKHILASIGKEAEVWVDANGRVAAKVGSTQVISGTVLVPRESWIFLQAIHNGRELKLLLNGTEVGSVPCRHDWQSPAPFVVGAAKDGIAGMIDEVRLSLIIPRDTYPLPPQVEFELPRGSKVADGEFIIAFDGGGRLEAARHPSALTLTIKSPTASKTLTITRQGLVLR
jgi:type II secretory pathway pseudopilin PulG